MLHFRSLPEQAWILLILPVFASYTLAALQNVTIDDAIMIGAVVPQYLPSESEGWNIGNKCPGCHAQPLPIEAYNGTWHDATFSASNKYTQSIHFSYTGSSLYIFFIIANTIPYTTTFTALNFMLDGVLVGSYNHIPTTSTDYEYNVPVYANDAVSFGDHDVVIQPITNLGNVLILFDYLIYTTDTPSPASPSSGTSLLIGISTTATPSSASSSPTSPSPTSSDTQNTTIGSAFPTSPGTQSTTVGSPSTTSSGTQRTYSRSNIGAIVGGTVGGIVAFALLVALLLCYRRYNRRDDGAPSAEEDMVDPFVTSDGVASAAPLAGTSALPVESFVTSLALRNKTFASSVMPPSAVPPTSTALSSSSSGEPSSDNSALLEQVGILRAEVARIRDMHKVNGNGIQFPLEAPPEYTS